MELVGFKSLKVIIDHVDFVVVIEFRGNRFVELCLELKYDFCGKLCPGNVGW